MEGDGRNRRRQRGNGQEKEDGQTGRRQNRHDKENQARQYKNEREDRTSIELVHHFHGLHLALSVSIPKD